MRELLRGKAASPGVARGRARVMVDPAHRPTLDDGDILVTLHADPMTLLEIVEHAAALVTDLGGVASHPAILCRELGLPAIVGTGSGTSTCSDGMLILVDGTKGIVYALD